MSLTVLFYGIVSAVTETALELVVDPGQPR
jgi:hypothetical protein